MIKAVLFDFFGVLADAKGHDSKKSAADAFGVTEQQLSPIFGRYINDFRMGIIFEEKFWQSVASDLNKNVPQNAHTLWRTGFENKLSVDKSLMDYINKLKSSGLKTGLISNTLPPWAEIVKNKGYFDHFDVVLNSCEVGLQKPDPQIYNLALSRLKVNGNECVYVDDSQDNLDTAKNLGMQIILATSPSQLISTLSTYFHTHQLE